MKKTYFYIFLIPLIFETIAVIKSQEDISNSVRNAPTSESIEQYFQQQCDCVDLKSCKTVLDIMSKVRRTPMAGFLLGKLQKSWCGFVGGEPLICCPHQQGYSTLTTEEPWVWDVSEKSNKSTENQLSSSSSEESPVVQRIFDRPDEFNLIDFEDPRTLKNCPPSFHQDNYDPFGNFYANKKFSHKHPWGPPFNGLPYPAWKYPNKEFSNNWKFHVHPEFDDNNFNNFNNNNNNNNNDNNNNNNNNGNVNVDQSDLRSRFNRNDALNSPQCGISVNTRIIGGTDSRPGQFPWMARIAYRNRSSGLISYRCAGSVINNKHIITAAHCVTNLVESLEVYFVRLGELETKRTRDCNIDPINCNVPQDYEIERLIPHPQYDTPKYANDIALIRLVSPLNTVDITPICLPMREFSSVDRNLTGRTVVVAGWASGRIGRRTPSLQYVQLPIVNRSKCAISYAQFSANSRTPIIVSASQICAQGKENSDACQGDSGGPLMTDGEQTDSRYVLLGLVSFGPRTCGISNFPGVYTRISGYIDWIIGNVIT